MATRALRRSCTLCFVCIELGPFPLFVTHSRVLLIATQGESALTEGGMC